MFSLKPHFDLKYMELLVLGSFFKETKGSVYPLSHCSQKQTGLQLKVFKTWWMR